MVINEKLNVIRELLDDGTLTDAVYAKLKQESDAKKAEKEYRIKQGKEQHRIQQEILNKPENNYPKLWNLRRVYPDELANYCMTYNLDALEAYAKGLAVGGCQSDVFKDGSGFAAFGYLNGKIQERKIKQNKGTSGTSKPEVAR
jgi:hypothetical protein